MKKTQPMLVLLSAAALAPALAAQTTLTFSQTDQDLIPDNDLNGLVEQMTIAAPFASISGLQVSLDITGGYDGDYYCYLSSGSGFAVLLNREGSSAGNPFGSPDSGYSVTFDDQAAAGNINLANAGGGTVTGTWQPDGRNVNPLTDVFDTAPTTTLASFDGLNPNGVWNLFIADVSPGGQGTLADWSLHITETIATVPDGDRQLGAWPFGLTGLLLCILHHRRRSC